MISKLASHKPDQVYMYYLLFFDGEMDGKLVTFVFWLVAFNLKDRWRSFSFDLAN